MPDLVLGNEQMSMTVQTFPDRDTAASRPTRPQPSVGETAGNRVRKNKQSLDYVLRSGLAGGVAGCAAKTLIAPLDRVKILFQASNPQFVKYTGSWFGVANAIRAIQNQEGILGLYRGHSATLLRIFPYAAIKFVAYEQYRAILIRSKDQETPFRRFLSGSLAGVTSVAFTYPLEVIRVRLAFETRKEGRTGLVGIVKRIYHENGYHVPAKVGAGSGAILPEAAKPIASVANFYRGFIPTVFGMLPYAGVSFLTHDLMGDWLRSPLLSPYTTVAHEPTPSSLVGGDKGYEHHGRKKTLKMWAELLSGGFAGLCSQTASYPLEIIRRRMQVGGALGNGKFLRIGETAKLIWKEAGFRGFWVGLTIGYIKIVPMTATSFFVYERSKLLLGI